MIHRRPRNNSANRSSPVHVKIASMDKKPTNPRSNKPKASHHGSELFALGSKPGTSREDASKKNLTNKPSSSGLGVASIGEITLRVFSYNLRDA